MDEKSAERMREYHEAVLTAWLDDKLSTRVANKLFRTRCPEHFYQCLKANGYLGDVWDGVHGIQRYPWISQS